MGHATGFSDAGGRGRDGGFGALRLRKRQLPPGGRHAGRIGPAYTIRGATYVPAAAPAYDAVGYASWYGSESGNQTANGEKFRPGWITAAHTTLPLPTYVEVTALDTGRRIIVRVNDRGPFARGRIIDLSRGAAEALGMRAQGNAPVRVV